jgi:hypothetical protein
MQALLKEHDMPTRYWGEAVTTAVFFLNRAPTKALGGKMFEAYHSHKPVVGYLKTFGYVGFIKDKRSGLKKLDHLSVCMVFEYSKGAGRQGVHDVGSKLEARPCLLLRHLRRKQGVAVDYKRGRR